MGITDKQQSVLLDMYLRKEDYSLVFDYIDSLRERMPQWKVALFENDFNQWFIAQPYYQDWSEKRSKYLPIVEFSSKSLKTGNYGSDKESRIMNLVHPYQTGTLVHNQDIVKSSDFKRYRAQYISFGTNKEKLDGLDAAATAFIMVRRYIESGNFKPLAERKMKHIGWLRRF